VSNRQALQHLVAGLDGLGIELVGALGLDHLTSSSTTLTLLASTKPCLMLPSALLPWGAGLRRAAAGGLQVEVLSLRVQAGRVDEAGQLDLAQGLRRGVGGGGDGDRAVGADADLLGARRHGDAGQQGFAVVGDDLTGRVDLEGAVARVGGAAVGHAGSGRSRRPDGDVERVVALLQRALREGALVATGRTPRPTCSPVGRLVCSVSGAPLWRRFWYIRSSNCAWLRL
jgi:hypothetical protein